MEESLLGIANTVEPTLTKLGTNTSKKYSFDEKTGDKIRGKSGGKGRREERNSKA